MEIGEAGEQQDLTGHVLPVRDEGATVAHTWHFFLSSADENELSYFTGDFVISLFPKKNFKAKEVATKVYAVLLYSSVPHILSP